MSWKQGNFRGRFARSSESAPLARTDDLVIEDLAGDGDGKADEVLVYDQRTDHAHCLSREAAMVWRVCDGKTQPEELAKALGFEVEMVNRAIAELSECGLLDAGVVTGITRREATMRMAKVGGAAAAAPLIFSILAPTPALAASQAYCLGISKCFDGGSGCSTCFKAGCVCCGAGSSQTSGTKMCTADCSCDPLTGCTGDIIHSHCGVCNNESTCTGGPNGPNGKCTGTPVGC